MKTSTKNQMIKDLFFNENLTVSIIARRVKSSISHVTKVINS